MKHQDVAREQLLDHADPVPGLQAISAYIVKMQTLKASLSKLLIVFASHTCVQRLASQGVHEFGRTRGSCSDCGQFYIILFTYTEAHHQAEQYDYLPAVCTRTISDARNYETVILQPHGTVHTSTRLQHLGVMRSSTLCFI